MIILGHKSSSNDMPIKIVIWGTFKYLLYGNRVDLEI